MSASMAEEIDGVLLAHRVSRTGHCACGVVLFDMSPERIAKHVAEALAAAGYGKLEDAQADGWDLGYEIGIRDWPECAVACGACKECMEPAKTNPYRWPE